MCKCNISEDEVGRKRWTDGIISRFMITDEIDEAIDSLACRKAHI